MANKPKRESQQDRRATLDAMRREQARSERRKGLLIVGVAAVIGILLVAAAAISAIQERRNDPARQDISSFGVPAADAGCGEVTTDEAEGVGEHVDPATTVDYDTVPPSSGPHFPSWAPQDRRFYTAEDRPAMENLVHNLEHGYTVVWYTDALDDEAVEELRGLSERMPNEAYTNGKFIVSAWDDAYGEFPEGMVVGMSRWTAEDGGKSQLCARVSGEAVAAFAEQFPADDAPEPLGG